MAKVLDVNHSLSPTVHVFVNKTFQTDRLILYSYTLYLAYAVIFFIGLVANIFVIVMIIKRRRMRTLTNRFLLNLAVSDLIATVVCLPPTAYHHHDRSWPFGQFLCRFVPFMQGTSVAVSIFTLMAVSIDRFIAIHKPIHSKLLCTPARVIITIVTTWLASFVLMIPLILHHRVVDHFGKDSTVCAEEWHRDMNARLAYDFLLLVLLFILPLTFMAYCYIRISFSLWFIDSNVRTSISSSILNAARFSTISEDFPNEIRRYFSPNGRPVRVHYRKANDYLESDEQRPSLLSDRHRRHTTFVAEHRYARPSIAKGRRFSANDSIHTSQPVPAPMQVRGRATPVRQRHSISQYTSGVLQSSFASIPGPTRLLNHSNKSTIDFEHASRFLQSRRRVVKLLVTLILVFFVTRLPVHILSIYIDATSSTYIPDYPLGNETNAQASNQSLAAQRSSLANSEKKMSLVVYVNPIFQLFSLSNSAINPLCYCFMSHAAKHILTFCQQRIRRGHKKCSSLTLVH